MRKRRVRGRVPHATLGLKTRVGPPKDLLLAKSFGYKDTWTISKNSIQGRMSNKALRPFN